MKIALAQLDAKVADLAGNQAKIRAFARRAKAAGAELCVFPEQALAGYPSLDLWEEPAFARANARALGALARRTGEMALLVGFVDSNPARRGKPVANAAALLHRGKIAAVRWKTLLPTYDVFDERRYFEPARGNAPIRFKGVKLGVTICEDAWAPVEHGARSLYGVDPVRAQAKAGADILINLSSSPFVRGKPAFRRELFSGHARRARRPMLYCNLVGGNDEMIFDGNSLVFDGRGRLCARGAAFRDDLVLVDTDALSPIAAEPVDEIDEVGEALCLGIRDYAAKCGFSSALIGISGGIDSAVVAGLAARALGPDRVTGVMMPSMYSSPGSISDAETLARNLGLRVLTIPITDIFEGFRAALKPAFRAGPGDASLAEQNLQSRARGMLLMALSNKEGSLLLSTGNKSELSVGYCTLYGDMNGGLAVLADVPKRGVYELARWLNRGGEVIPRASIEKPPSAELKPNQTDQDDLPPYDVVDAVLEDYIEGRLDAPAIARGRKLDRALVESLLNRIDRAEYKRRQAPPSLKVSPKAFGVGRRMPIARGSYRK